MTILYLSLLILFTYTMIFPFEIAFHISKAIHLCCNSVIPSLFMFICLSNFMAEIIIAKVPENRLYAFLSRILSLPVSLVPVCLAGLICGTPSGSVSISRLYDEGKCSKKDAESALVLSNNCSAAFICGIVSSVLESKSAAYLILISNILTTIIVYMLFFRPKYSDHSASIQKESPISMSRLITKNISSSAYSCITLCGYIIFFYTMSSVVAEKISFILCTTHTDSNIASIIKSTVMCLFEMSSGIISSAEICGITRIVIVSSAVAFCGISVFLQIKSIIEKNGLSSRKLILSKILCAVISPLITLFLLSTMPTQVIPASVQISQNRGGFGSGEFISLTIISCFYTVSGFILSYLDKNHKIRR